MVCPLFFVHTFRFNTIWARFLCQSSRFIENRGEWKIRKESSVLGVAAMAREVALLPDARFSVAQLLILAMEDRISRFACRASIFHFATKTPPPHRQRLKVARKMATALPFPDLVFMGDEMACLGARCILYGRVVKEARLCLTCDLYAKDMYDSVDKDEVYE
jgi:hypothetical protein